MESRNDRGGGGRTAVESVAMSGRPRPVSGKAGVTVETAAIRTLGRPALRSVTARRAA